MSNYCPPPTTLAIGDVVVQQDAHGRYSLNDLHRAAIAGGANPRTKEPGKFLAGPHIRDLIQELTEERETTQELGSSPVTTMEGRGGGTFVSRPLVYAYAMWVSPAFHLRVIEVFDAVVRGVPVPGAAPAFLVPKSLSEALRLAADLAEENERQAQQIEAQSRVIEEQRPAMEFLERFVKAKGSAGVRRVAKGINRRQNDLVRELLRDKVLYYEGKYLVPFAKYQDKGYFVVKLGEKNGHAFTHARFTAAGINWVADRYGREAPSESTARLLPAPSQPAAQLPLLPEPTQP